MLSLRREAGAAVGGNHAGGNHAGGLSARLRALPRDTRDTLFLLAVIGWILLPQLGRLPPWCSALAVGVLAWRGWLSLRARPLPQGRWILVLLVVTIAATWLNYSTLLGRDAGVTLIVGLLALKTLELRARRDAFVIFFLGFFTMLTNFFFSQSLLVAAAMLIGLLGLLTALVNAHMPVGRPPLVHAARTAGWMALLGAPVMAALFMLFPRLAPLWGIPDDAMSGRSGLSSTMEVGAIASLALDDSIAMRIRFDGPVPAPFELYFRGPVLSQFDGREWRAAPRRFDVDATFDRLQVAGRAVHYQVTLQPDNRPWVFVLDAADRAPQLPGYELTRGPALLWRANRPITDIVRYRATSHPDFRYDVVPDALTLQRDLELPAGYDPRTLALAAQIRSEPRYADADALTLVNLVLARLRGGGYRYTLEPGTYGRNTADEFWFDRKQGFCEHIASAFVVLMRALGVPARIVTGYQGGSQNPVDGDWVVRQSDAHAWAEVWSPGRGWVRVDPTAAVAPSRIGALARLAPPAGVFASVIDGVSPTLAHDLRAFWEAMNNRWNQWVLNYTQSRQFDLLRSLGFDAPSREDLGRLLIALVVAASLLAAAWSWWDQRQHDPWLRLLERVRARLRALGLPLAASAPPRAIAAAARQRFGDAAAPLADWLLRLEALRYAATERGRLAPLQRELERLKWPR
ncbi:MAG: transglutaminase-like enzyme [Burkholderiaceae bacterium]|jgi:transglutaminase-like putative cysteine protease|nr:MAG: transglutaminase-like enzyme [Burkholderiaceae bacterium]